MSLYTKNGKLLVKDVNGTLKLVTGDCCCGCESDSKCGLPHTIINFSDPSNPTSAWKNGTTAVLELWFSSGDDGYAIDQASTRNGRDFTDWVVRAHDGYNSEWNTNCEGNCSSVKRESKITWSRTIPDINVYQYGTVSVFFTGTPDDSSNPPSVSFTATVSKAFKSVVVYGQNNNEYVAGDSFPFIVTMGGFIMIHIYDPDVWHQLIQNQ